MNWLPKAVPPRERAAALIIVLAFVVLLTGVAIAYLSRTTSDRQVAHSSFNQSNVDQLTQSAMDNIIGDLRQEVVDGSTATTVTVNGVDVTIYTPTSATYMVPQRNVNLAGVYNLIRRSVHSDPLVPPARPSRASAVNSMTDVSANGRYVTSTRWNGHYLIPKGDVNTSDPSPTPTFNPVTPDWIFFTNAGATPSPPPGRVAYISRKGTVAFADLTALSLTPGGSTPNPMTVSRIVGWRNYATTTVRTTSNFPDLSPSPSPFVTYFLDNSRDFLTVNPIANSKGRTDQAFSARSELIQLMLSSIGTSPNLLQYLGTFSREQNSPTWQSAS